MKLVYKATGLPVQVGDTVAVRDGSAQVDSFPKPHKPESSGYVYLSNGANYYVSVIGAEWIEREDREA